MFPAHTANPPRDNPSPTSKRSVHRRDPLRLPGGTAAVCLKWSPLRSRLHGYPYGPSGLTPVTGHGTVKGQLSRGETKVGRHEAAAPHAQCIEAFGATKNGINSFQAEESDGVEVGRVQRGKAGSDADSGLASERSGAEGVASRMEGWRFTSAGKTAPKRDEEGVG
ncbi:MAG: hypothetical protein Q9207_006514 [Kuettlingeria erythrocarpa]